MAGVLSWCRSGTGTSTRCRRRARRHPRTLWACSAWRRQAPPAPAPSALHLHTRATRRRGSGLDATSVGRPRDGSRMTRSCSGSPLATPSRKGLSTKGGTRARDVARCGGRSGATGALQGAPLPSRRCRPCRRRHTLRSQPTEAAQYSASAHRCLRLRHQTVGQQASTHHAPTPQPYLVPPPPDTVGPALNHPRAPSAPKAVSTSDAPVPRRRLSTTVEIRLVSAEGCGAPAGR